VTTPYEPTEVLEYPASSAIPPIYTLAEAAEKLGMTERYLANELGYAAYRIGTGLQYRLTADDLDEWMLSRSWGPKQYLSSRGIARCP
jgi:hypothetical protein